MVELVLHFWQSVQVAQHGGGYRARVLSGAGNADFLAEGACSCYCHERGRICAGWCSNYCALGWSTTRCHCLQILIACQISRDPGAVPHVRCRICPGTVSIVEGEPWRSGEPTASDCSQPRCTRFGVASPSRSTRSFPGFRTPSTTSRLPFELRGEPRQTCTSHHECR